MIVRELKRFAQEFSFADYYTNPWDSFNNARIKMCVYQRTKHRVL
jgi:hypothetical protein